MGSASPVTGPLVSLVSPLAVVMLFAAHRPRGMQWVRVPNASGCISSVDQCTALLRVRFCVKSII